MKKKLRSSTHVTIALAAALVLLWIACIGFMTWAVAVMEVDRLTEGLQTARIEMENVLQNFVDAGWIRDSWGNESVKDTDSEKSAFWTDRSCQNEAFLEVITACADTSFGHSYMLPEISLLSDDDPDIDRAVLVYDSRNEAVFQNGDYLYFHYRKDMTSADDETDEAFGYIDLDALEGEGAEYLRQNYRIGELGSYLGDTLKITGVVNGDEIIPYSIERLAEDDALSGDWTVEYETGEKSADSLVVYVDADDLNTTVPAKTPGTYQASDDGKVWNNYTEYVKAAEEKTESLSEYDLDSRTLLHYSQCVHIWIYDDPDAENADQSYDICYAFSMNPLKCAVQDLKFIYLITAAVTLLLFWILRSIIIGKMLRPQEKLVIAMEQKTLPEQYEKKVWRETEQLRESYVSLYQDGENKDMEIRRLNQALLYANEAEQNRRQLTNGIAHELKTPLAIIHSYAEGLQNHIAEEKRDRYLETILTESEKLDDMIMEMLDLSRLEAGRIKLTLDEISLSRLAGETLSRYDRMIEDKRIELTTDLPDTPSVMADEARIIQVMDNFLSNAVRYTPEGGKIHVSCFKDQAQVCFSVENTGKPFTTEELRRVWDTFYKTDNSRSGKGTGLGLAIAKNVVALHGGSVSVNNTKDGVKFGFKLNI